MLTYGFIIALVSYAYLYWRFARWMKRKERREDLKIEADRQAYQDAVRYKYRTEERKAA